MTELPDDVPALVRDKVAVKRGEGMDFLKVHAWVNISVFLVETGNVIFVIQGDGQWSQYPYDALSDFTVQYGQPTTVTGIQAITYFKDRFL